MECPEKLFRENGPMLILGFNPRKPLRCDWWLKRRQQHSPLPVPVICCWTKITTQGRDSILNEVLSNPTHDRVVPTFEALVFMFKSRPYASLHQCWSTIP